MAYPLINNPTDPNNPVTCWLAEVDGNAPESVYECVRFFIL